MCREEGGGSRQTTFWSRPMVFFDKSAAWQLLTIVTPPSKTTAELLWSPFVNSKVSLMTHPPGIHYAGGSEPITAALEMHEDVALFAMQQNDRNRFGQRIVYSLNTGNDYALFFGCAIIRNFKPLVLDSLGYHDGTFGTEGWQFNSPELLTLSYSYAPVVAPPGDASGSECWDMEKWMNEVLPLLRGSHVETLTNKRSATKFSHRSATSAWCWVRNFKFGNDVVHQENQKFSEMLSQCFQHVHSASTGVLSKSALLHECGFAHTGIPTFTFSGI
ncbi:predicted protein [Postia placenta Mad-698-R]|uniref:Uncharacterized protein n=1 Tax=Postia placenta MAD-698-R-SB12 TaxID=670580 RepID=A0A1X6MN77_9APHY|nr:hypothetical protein POSPLADRAFT_1156250 [Postia placenta MAD-698-R-SB12]EED81628.1 predicted protein [Postia placenta Mad-698-R]OSX57642.1 hypothetical protein POSPLADRAFT_1156250 [Postia placenta MAD-698-R-SB12]